MVKKTNNKNMKESTKRLIKDYIEYNFTIKELGFNGIELCWDETKQDYIADDDTPEEYVDCYDDIDYFADYMIDVVNEIEIENQDEYIIDMINYNYVYEMVEEYAYQLCINDRHYIYEYVDSIFRLDERYIDLNMKQFNRQRKLERVLVYED